MAHSRRSVTIKEEKRKGGTEKERGGRRKGKERKKEGKFMCGCLTLRIKPLTLKAAAKYPQICRTAGTIHSKGSCLSYAPKRGGSGQQ